MVQANRNLFLLSLLLGTAVSAGVTGTKPGAHLTPVREFVTTPGIVAYVNYQEVFQGALGPQKMMKDLEEEKNKLEKEKQSATETFQKEVMEYQKSMDGLTIKAREEKEAALKAKYTPLEKALTDKEVALAKKHNMAISDSEEKIGNVIKQICELHNIAIVHTSGALAYVSKNMEKNNITQDVIKKFNELYPLKIDKPKTPVKK